MPALRHLKSILIVFTILTSSIAFAYDHNSINHTADIPTSLPTYSLYNYDKYVSNQSTLIFYPTGIVWEIVYIDDLLDIIHTNEWHKLLRGKHNHYFNIHQPQQYIPSDIHSRNPAGGVRG